MSFSAVIFDLDGVIADTETVQLRAINFLLAPFGFSILPEEWATYYVGYPIEKDVSDIHSRFRACLVNPLLNLKVDGKCSC